MGGSRIRGARNARRAAGLRRRAPEDGPKCNISRDGARGRTSGPCAGGEYLARICRWYSFNRCDHTKNERHVSSPTGRRHKHNLSQWHEAIRPCSQSARDPAPARPEPGAVLDADRRHPERRLALRKRTRDAEAGARAAAARARRADRPVAGEARRLRDHQLSQGIASRPVPQPAPRGEEPASGTARTPPALDHRSPSASTADATDAIDLPLAGRRRPRRQPLRACSTAPARRRLRFARQTSRGGACAEAR